MLLFLCLAPVVTCVSLVLWFPVHLKSSSHPSRLCCLHASSKEPSQISLEFSSLFFLSNTLPPHARLSFPATLPSCLSQLPRTYH